MSESALAGPGTRLLGAGPAPARMPERAVRLVALGYAVTLGTVTVQSAAHIVGVRMLDDRFFNLNADVEGNTIAWAGAAATFAAAFAAFVLALVPALVDRRLLVLVAILAFFSLDDAIGLHERLAERGADAFGLSDEAQRIVWPPVYLPILALTVLLLLDAARRIPAEAARALRLGIVLLVAAVAAELGAAFLGVVLDVERGSWPDVLEVVVEEGAEIGGWLLIAFALAAAVTARLAQGERA